MATATELIAAAGAATTTEELDAIEAQADGRVTVLDAVEQGRTRLFLDSPPEAKPTTKPPPEQPGQHGPTGDPDFVWVGCNTCWHPRDEARPVRAYTEWLADGMRYLTYTCLTCSNNSPLETVEVFPSLFGFWMENAVAWQEGGPAPTQQEVKRWGV